MRERAMPARCEVPQYFPGTIGSTPFESTLALSKYDCLGRRNALCGPGRIDVLSNPSQGYALHFQVAISNFRPHTPGTRTQSRYPAAPRSAGARQESTAQSAGIRRPSRSLYRAFAISTAKTCTGPSMFDRKMIHFMSGENVTFGSNR